MADRYAGKRFREAAMELRRQMLKIEERTGGTGPGAHRAVNDMAVAAVKRFDDAVAVDFEDELGPPGQPTEDHE